MLNKSDFLCHYHFSASQYEQTGLDWTLLERIYSSHTANIPQLDKTAEYISHMLREVPAVHSLKFRSKHPEHLVAKIIRKKLENPSYSITIENYADQITDLIGIRALHLFKDDWRPIHDFVTATWELQQPPIAYVRDGDPSPVTTTFTRSGCTVQEHPFGYRSVHYILKSQPAKNPQLAELQVRTLFEEGWSEIDHLIRYPRQTENTYLAEFLTIFNRLAGSADEMGTFIKALSQYLEQQSAKLTETASQLDAREKELKQTISQLKIKDSQKRSLEKQVEDLRESSQLSSLTRFSTSPILGAADYNIPISSLASVTSMCVCTKCGRTYQSDSPLMFSIYPSICPDCRKEWTLP